jgi:hypothetical protein
MASLAARRASIARILMRVSESTPAGGAGAGCGAGAAGGAAAGLGGAATGAGAGGGACAAGGGRRMAGWLKGVGAEGGAPLGSPVGLGSGGICLVALQAGSHASKSATPEGNTR